ncbi:hypothetical protein FGIG_09274 [Fasciola gigantica]|uniref:MaoC-like domain-containing protein n=1 Tax=Fasciola gigantica TaxID=46835 RepID=A0A504ZA63_FASGI|nr:hypothetical protein FGIG_09274 [Fasciola gigantica]
MVAFTHLTGDTNSLHLVDADCTCSGPFGRPVVHGILTLGLVSCLLGTHFPGPGCLLHSLNCQFTAPLYPDEECIVHAEVAEVQGRRVTFHVRVVASRRETV